MGYTKIGIYDSTGIIFDIVMTDNLEYYLISSDGILEKFLWKDRIYCLSEPEDHIIYYVDDLGVHYKCLIYDAGIAIDLYAKDIEKLLNIICNMIAIPNKLFDKINSIEE